MTFPEEKRNLIHIYLESMENTFFSKDLGGFFDENLMPDLAELSKEGYNFSHQSEGFGGPPRSTGGNWSVASFVNQGTGLPMKVPTERNSYGAENNFLPGATAIGDILKAQGYEQSVMFGADASFGGLDFYFESHGDFNIYDHKGAIEAGWIDEHYNVWWGYEDDKLYEFAKTELTRLASTDKPFHFIMETADTHAPEGWLSPNAENKFDTQYANCIYYSQAEVVKFVRWIQQQDFYENTTIVICGDHTSMDNSYFIKNIDKNYDRHIYNCIINAPIEAENQKNRIFTPFDMFPTTIAALGATIEGDRLGMGVNLYSDKQTLAEEYTFEVFTNEIVRSSEFYYNNFYSKNKQ
jgi:phosphoglycerol transferase